ncbi:MAG TPA: phage antirepressor N-terminal domain-containing protein, partial [Ktedonobacterales bacterium]|nr:phage antirepressor N-terminal domain-containing protein [Ktedonobacterales bacterium]
MPEWDMPMRIIYDTLHLAQFGVDVPIVRVEGMGDYFPVRPLCKALGIASHPQVERIQNDPDYVAGIETFTIPTAGGPQETVCLRKREVAWWLGKLDPRLARKLEARFSVTLADFKQSLMDAADALWWGVRAVVPAALSFNTTRVEVTMHLSCLRCRTLHRFTSDGKHTSWEI